MLKILVTTDFSTNSKAGIRFAIQLSSQVPCELTFFHAYYILSPTSWNEKHRQEYELGEVAKIEREFKSFVKGVYRSLNKSSNKAKFIMKSSVTPASEISQYASLNNFDYICISTSGAGKLKKIIGTNTSKLISESDVPVIAIPKTYRTTKIKSILYASDLNGIEEELKTVIGLAKELKAEVELLHFNSPEEYLTDKSRIETAVKKYSSYRIKLHVENIDPVLSFISNLEKAVDSSKPSLMLMFTHRKRSFFDRIFSSSNSAEYTFKSKVPLLVFSKKTIK